MSKFERESVHSVFDAEGELDLDRLTKEMSGAVFEDKRYSNVDSMKKKAIHTSKDYDEFKSFVACAQDMLRPVSSVEFRELTKGKQGWKHSAASRATKASSRSEAAPNTPKVAKPASGTTLSAPKQPADFDRAWRRCRDATDPAKTLETRAAYLGAHPPRAFGKCFSRDLDATTMCEVVLAIHAMPREDAQAAQQTISLLDAVARAPRFSLSVMFLEQQHKDAVTAILAAANALAPAEQPNADADTPPLEASKDALSKIAALYGL
ncbi:hypothetical protein M885DRAFT_512407 [Pelagophyceae sp. CCMP2097]|nr:hypothetical protein M885DRAFT_512407 [Pelagophyceae sp. CCMP2097]|mmetsp:Transcript_31523/g.106146  ORF Transcript_31523/g.106146 Transcript_31523/m.106146 type:complete len:265 (+) Transcript_31523:70-864(+)